VYHVPVPLQTSLFAQETKETPVVLSYGMGIDSTAILLRWLEEPGSRDFELKDLTVLTAQTGNEFSDTKRLVEAHILPLLRRFHIRYVQIARSGPLQGDGLTLLDDSREPTQLHIDGDFKLSDELQANGTVPQVATGQRRCTHHFKGFPLTYWTDREYGDQAIRKVIGYNADELDRVHRSEGYSTDSRETEHPLVEWGWGRKRCEEYVAQIVGETWRKSCCTFCPFAGGKPDILGRYRQFPAEAAEALFLEHVSLAFNPRMALYARKSLRLILEKDGNTEALRLLEERLTAVPWAVYRVRRIVWAKGRADRKTERAGDGTREAVVARLTKAGGCLDGGTARLYVRQRGNEYPMLEDMLVAAPAVVEEKSRPRFEENWQRLAERTLWDQT
jgi:hypothetical protein